MKALQRSLRFLVFLPLLYCGCNLNGPDASTEFASVRVVDEGGNPIAGVNVRGGVMDGAYSLFTGTDGIVKVPVNTVLEPFSFSKTNFRSITVTGLAGDVVLRRAPRSLSPIGTVEGRVVSWQPGKIVTVSSDGTYRCYACTDKTVDALSTVQLNDTLRDVVDAALFGDTLWIATRNNGLFAYSIRMPSIPQPLGRVSCPAGVGLIAVSDSVIAIAGSGSVGVRVLVHSALDGAWTETWHGTAGIVTALAFRGASLCIMGDRLPALIDLTDPRAPGTLLASPESGGMWRGILADDYLMLVRRSMWTPETSCLVKRFAPSGLPATIASYVTESPVHAFVTDSVAIGWDRGTVSILTGSIETGFHLAAVAAGDGIAFQGASPPLFVIGNKLWILR